MVDDDVLRAVPFFADLDPRVVAALGGHAEEVRLGSAAVLFEQNEDARDVYFLLAGSVEVLLRYEGVGELFMGTYEDVGTLLGWSAFCPPHRYSDSVRCHRPSRLLRVPDAGFAEVMSDPAVGYELLRRVNAEVAHQLETTRQLIDTALDQTQEL